MLERQGFIFRSKRSRRWHLSEKCFITGYLLQWRDPYNAHVQVLAIRQQKEKNGEKVFAVIESTRFLQFALH